MVRAYKAGIENKETPSIIPVKRSARQPEEPERQPEAPLQAAEPPVVKEDFSQDELTAVWKSFTASKISNGVSDALKMIFAKPLLKGEGGVVVIEVSTDIERKFLKTEEAELTQFLRRELSFPGLSLSIAIKEAEVRQRLYTDKEKFNYLAEKQPLLLRLKEKLFLDTDF